MSTIQEMLQQAQLAEAAYANLIDSAGNIIADVIGLKTALKAEGMSEFQADDFVTHWSVISQQSDTATGFSATLFQRRDNDPVSNKWGQRQFSKNFLNY